MHLRISASLSLGILLFAGINLQPVVPAPAEKGKEHKADVIVYGGTVGGVVAAVAAAREGKSVILLEPGKHIGGMASGGLGATDTGNRATIGGYSREFFDRVKAHYVKKYGADSQQVKDCSDGFRFEPHVAELILREMLKEAKVDVHFGQRLLEVETLSELKDGKRIGPRIVALRTEKDMDYTAQVYIDASYEGDVMAKAGVKYTVGREGREKYNEPLAGVQEYSPKHQWPIKLSAFDEKKQLLPLISQEPLGKPGEADKKVQAYNFRMCMTKNKDNLVPWPKPKNYDPKRYELMARYLEKKPDLKVGQLMNPIMMPNGKTDTNNNGPISTDHIGANWDYPEADYKRRAEIWQDHGEYQQGLMYFLANDPRVPKALQEEMRSWGLAKDEFTDTDHWPHQLYIREARRMIGEYVITQHDVAEKRTKEDSVGMGSYNMDSHHVQRVVDKDGNVLNEGDFQIGTRPYAIPYRSLVPKHRECDNLLVPVCCSTSHVAYGSVRMEPVFMILGQASGVAACLAIDHKTSVQHIPLDKLIEKLKQQKAVLSPDELPMTSVPSKGLDPAKLPGIIVDDTKAGKTGHWTPSRSGVPYVGDSYLHDNNDDKGKKSIRFTPHLPSAGKYEVFLYYASNPNRATNVPVVIHSREGEKTVKVNQRNPLKEHQPLRLGAFEFDAGDKGWVEIRTTDTDGYVIADAVGFVKQE